MNLYTYVGSAKSMKPPFTILPLVTDMKYGRARECTELAVGSMETRDKLRYYRFSGIYLRRTKRWYRTKATRIDDRQWRRRRLEGGIGVFFLIVVNWFGRDWFPLLVEEEARRKGWTGETWQKGWHDVTFNFNWRYFYPLCERTSTVEKVMT